MTALLALHGFTGSPRSWDFLPERPQCARLVPALVGHRGSAAGAEIVDFESEVDRLARLSAERGPLHVVGYSLGARLALGLAVRYRSQVERLTLISGHPGLNEEAERADRRAADERWCALLQSRGLTAFVEAWQALPLWASQSSLDQAALARKRSERLSHDPAGLVRSLRVTGLAAMPNYREALAALRMPVTLVAGRLDTKFQNLAREMAKLIPAAELHIVDAAGHDLLLERPQLMAELILRGNLT